MCDDVKFVNEKGGQSVDVGSPKDVEGVKETDGQKSCSRFDWALTLKRKLQVLERKSGTSRLDQVLERLLEWQNSNSSGRRRSSGTSGLQ
ncbi:unnamed protein product [Prunus armeniaca]